MAPVNEAARLLDTAMALCTAPKTLTLEIRGRERERDGGLELVKCVNGIVVNSG